MYDESNPRSRALELIARHRKMLDVLEEKVRDTNRHVTNEQIALVESLLVETSLVGRRLIPDYLHLTGPSGYDPEPVYVKCDKCDHYRLR